MFVEISLPNDVKSVSIRRNSPLRMTVRRQKRIDELVEDGLLLCECTVCGEQFLMFSKVGNVRCPACAGKATKQWRRLKVGLVPER